MTQLLLRLSSAAPWRGADSPATHALLGVQRHLDALRGARSLFGVLRLHEPTFGYGSLPRDALAHRALCDPVSQAMKKNRKGVGGRDLDVLGRLGPS